jgi:cytochrome c2
VKLLYALGGASLLACAGTGQEADGDRLTQGARTYQKCYSCHALEAGRNDLSGPTLHKIVGRRIAAEPGFAYSPALMGFAAREPRWTKQLLNRFAADPEGLVPGTSMTFHGIPDAREREALIAWLERRQTRARAASRP